MQKTQEVEFTRLVDDDAVEPEQPTSPKNHANAQFKVRLAKIALSLVVMLLLAKLPIFDEEDAAAQRCGAILGLVSVLWITGAIPTHITALLIPMLVVFGNVMRVPPLDSPQLIQASLANSSAPGTVLSPKDAAVLTSTAFFDPVVLMFLGGFTMAAGLEKYKLSRLLAQWILRIAGKRPSRILLSLILLSVFMSALVSNVATALLLTAIINPLLKRLPAQSQWPKMALLGIAYGCNIGGMTTPIASPQNIVALVSVSDATAGKYEVSFFSWCAYALPLAIVLSLLVWVWLRFLFKTRLPRGIDCDALLPQGDELMTAETPLEHPGGDDPFGLSSPGTRGRKRTAGDIFVPYVSDAPKRSKFGLGVAEWTVLLTCGGTIGLWIGFSVVEGLFGNLGIVALLPIIVLFGFGLLNRKDFDSMNWSVLILMGGGLSLGDAVQSSGLLSLIATGMTNALQHSSFWLIMLCFNGLCAMLSNVISSTVAAIIVCPIIAKVGLSFNHPAVLAVSAAIQCSGAMGLPVSSFPNANSITAKDKFDEPFLEVTDFAKSGFIVAILTLTVLQTYGVLMSSLLGW